MTRLLTPEDPLLLVDFLEARVKAEKDLACFASFSSAINAAVSMCAARVVAKAERSRIFFAIAKLRLFQGHADEALFAYCQGISTARGCTRVGEQLESILDLQLHFRDAPADLRSGLERLRRLAVLGAVIKGGATERIVRHGLAADDRGCCVMSKGFPKRIDAPVAIVAGGTLGGLDLAPYRETLASALQGFSGTLFSGGTTAGIAGIVGDVASGRKTSPVLMACLPAKYRIFNVSEHRAYRIFRTDGDDFSTLEPLQNWIDLLGTGVKPASVRLLVINGGKITRFEIHLALALGAVVGVVEGSGREADRILREEPWWTTGRLVRLPNDGKAVRDFLYASKGQMP